MFIAEMMGRFVTKAGFAEADAVRMMVSDYKAGMDQGALVFPEWAVMHGKLTPEQARTVIDFFDSSRFQCLECGSHVYGREFLDDVHMICPHCEAREFNLRGTAMSAAKKQTRVRKAPGPPPADGSDDPNASNSATSLIEAAAGAKTASVSRAPKLPMGGGDSSATKVIAGKAKGEEERRKPRAVPLELLQVMKGQPLDEFLKELPSYRLQEWNAALVLIAYMKRGDLIPLALKDAERRFADLAMLSIITRSVPGSSVSAQLFVYELVRQTASAVARLGAFQAHKEEALEPALKTLQTAMPGPRLHEAQIKIRDTAAAEVVERLAFMLTGKTVQDILSLLQMQWLPEDVNAGDALEAYLSHPEPIVRALVAHVSSHPDSPVDVELLDNAIGSEVNPFVNATLQSAIDRRGGIESATMSQFDKVMVLKQIPLFASLDRDSIVSVASVAEESSVPEGEPVFLQDTTGDSAYILVEGTVAVVRTDFEGGERRLADLSAPFFFGEMAILG
ncbi:MAG: cyclic nucleotide-binding domain-containing protein [Planctomycetota bacterium]